MPVENRIVKIQKRNRSLVRFDPDRIRNAILRAGRSVGGFHHDWVPGINDRLFQSGPGDEEVSDCLTDSVLLCLNADPDHLISNYPPTIEAIQDKVMHVLRSHGLQRAADAYACYRWSRHWLREGDVTPDQFTGNGLDTAGQRAAMAWNIEQGCHTQEHVNEQVRGGRLAGLVEAALARQQEQLARAARTVIARLQGPAPLRLIWIAGPTSSGKTTLTVQLTRQLEREGVRFLMLNLDDYFWPLAEHPTDWINDRNYETPEALDIQLINQHLRILLDGGAVEKPVFSFKEGRHVGTRTVRLEKDQVLLLDCLHGLYPPLIDGIDRSAEFRVYANVRTAMYEGDGGTKRLILSDDVRLLRRMLRDCRHRNSSPLFTLLHWHYVRAGELFSILPFEGRADVVLNGGFPFDLTFMHPLLCGDPPGLPRQESLRDYAGFLDARIRLQRLERVLGNTVGLPLAALNDLNLLPGDALIREFIGGSTVKIPHNE
ncbi:MAG: ATP cone domain-containing protein [Verrucomicrobia bacterium]|jgi:uridine kinase|nr:ATP cone domain-containing protein [Verrucomicrobiota bacterium]